MNEALEGARIHTTMKLIKRKKKRKRTKFFYI